jgi:hypothetical protein
MILPGACARKFRVQREIKSGGFGAVLLATQSELDRPVALKLLRPDILENADQRARFANEARVTAAIDHPHIVRVFDHGVDEGVPWIAYEYLPGRTLSDALQDGPMDWRSAATAAAQIASALEAAHGAGILHRDVKPDNVLESSAGHWKITDFGIAKWTSATEVKTETGVVLGTPAYMAPELLKGAPASPASDLHALGVMLFETLTARLPFTGDTALQMMQARLTEPAPPLASVSSGLPPSLADLVDALLAADPGRRPPSAARVRAALEAILRGSAPAPLAPPTARVRASRSVPLTQVARARRPFPALAAALCLAVCISIPLLYRATRPPPPPPAPVPTGAPDLTPLAQLEADIEEVIRDPLPGPSLMTIIDRLTHWDGPRLARVPQQVAAYGAWHQRKSTRAEALAERLEMLRQRPYFPPEALRALSARLEIHRYTYLLDIDQSAKLAVLARRLVDGSLALNPVGGEAEIAEALTHEKSRETGLSHVLVGVRGAMEDLLARPASATRQHGVLFDSVRWFAGQFSYYRFATRDVLFATREAKNRLLTPLAQLPGARAQLVSEMMSDAWLAGNGTLKLNADVLPAALARVRRLAAETPGLGDGLEDIVDAYGRFALVPQNAADPFERYVRPRLRKRGALAIAVLKGGEVKETRCYGSATPATVFDLGVAGTPLAGLALAIAMDRGSTKLKEPADDAALEKLVSQVAKVPLAELVQREVFAKAGMKSASWTDGRGRASLNDLIAFDRALAKGTFATRPPAADGDYSFGWHRGDDRKKGLLWRHDYDRSTCIARHVAAGLTVIVLCDAPRVDVERIQREVAALYLSP